MQQLATYLLIGLGIGLISGALGIGGGVLMVPALMMLTTPGFNFDKARGTSLAVLVLPVALPGAWKYFCENHVDIMAAVAIAVAFAVGGYLGASVVQHLPGEGSAIRFAFGCMMLFLAMRYIISSSDEASMAIGGLAALALALPGYWALRLLGRHYPPRPELSQKMQQMAEQEQGGHDYSI